jgi:hypothetical protein
VFGSKQMILFLGNQNLFNSARHAKKRLFFCSRAEPQASKSDEFLREKSVKPS